MPKLLKEIYGLQTELTTDADEQRLLKMCANLLESHYEVKQPRNSLTADEYLLLRALRAGQLSTGDGFSAEVTETSEPPAPGTVSSAPCSVCH